MNCPNCNYQTIFDKERCPRCGHEHYSTVSYNNVSVLPKVQEENTSQTLFDNLNTNETFKKCPYCGETIQSIAIKCKHCGEFLNESIRNQKLKETVRTSREETLKPFNRVASILGGFYFIGQGILCFLPLFAGSIGDSSLSSLLFIGGIVCIGIGIWFFSKMPSRD